MTATMTFLQLRAHPAMCGRVIALATLLSVGSTPIGGFVTGWVAEHHGVRVALLLGGVSAIGAGLSALVALRRSPARDLAASTLVPASRSDLSG